MARSKIEAQEVEGRMAPPPVSRRGRPRGECANFGDATPNAAHPVRSSLTRVIHLLLLLAVLHQLIGSQFMRLPFPGDPPGWTLSLHEYVGLANFAVVAAFWVWAVIRRGETRLGYLLPWFSIARLRAVIVDLKTQLRRLARGHAPDEGAGALASAIHGLGLLAVTAMTVTGCVYFLMQGTHLARTALSVHKLLANLVWIYLFAHAGLAVLHHLLGSDILSRMFWLAPRRAGPSDRGQPSGE
jgi:cytochrome b561